MDYYEQRRHDAMVAFENARAARMAALSESLHAVRTSDADVMNDEEIETLRQAAGVVARLHSIW